MSLTGISSTAWNVVKYYTEENRYDALRGLSYFGKVVNYSKGTDLSGSPLVKQCASALACSYPLEFFADVVSFFEKVRNEKTSREEITFQSALCLEAFPRAYNTLAGFFGWNKEALPSWVRITGDAAGLYAGSSLVYKNAKALYSGSVLEENKSEATDQSTRDLTTAEKVGHYGWSIFGAGWAIGNGIALGKTLKLFDAKKVPSWVPMVTASMTIIGYLSAAYVDNNK